MPALKCVLIVIIIASQLLVTTPIVQASYEKGERLQLTKSDDHRQVAKYINRYTESIRKLRKKYFHKVSGFSITIKKYHFRSEVRTDTLGNNVAILYSASKNKAKKHKFLRVKAVKFSNGDIPKPVFYFIDTLNKIQKCMDDSAIFPMNWILADDLTNLVDDAHFYFGMLDILQLTKLKKDGLVQIKRR